MIETSQRVAVCDVWNVPKGIFGCWCSLGRFY